MSNLSDTKPLPIPPEPKPRPQNVQNSVQRTQNAPQMQRRTQSNGQTGQRRSGQHPYSRQNQRPVQRQNPQTVRANPYQRPNAQAQMRTNYPEPDFTDYDEDEIEDYEYDYTADAGIRRPSFQQTQGEPRPQYRRQQTPEFDYEPERPQKKSRKRKKRRRKHSCLCRIIVTLLTTAVILFGIYSGIVLLGIKRVRYEPTDTRNLTESMAEPDEKVHNLLLVITDSNGKDRGRADAIMMISTSKHNQTITVSSFMPDSYVSIPSHDTDKLAAAYNYGGATLLMDTIVNNFGIPVDDNICINFKSFIRLTDALGGVKLTLTDDEAAAVNKILKSEINNLMSEAESADLLPSGGTFLLNGKQALAYARIRVSQTADFINTQRQRAVMSLILERLKHPSPGAVPKLLANALPELSTNMSNGALYLRAIQAPFTLYTSDMQTLRLPADDTYTVQTAPNGQTVLAVNFEKNLDLYLTAVREEQAPHE